MSTHTGLRAAFKGTLLVLLALSPNAFVILGIIGLSIMPQEWAEAIGQAFSLTLNRPVDLRVPSLIVSTMLLGVGLAQLYQERVIIGLLALALIVDIFLAVHLSVTREDEQLRIACNAITAVSLGLSAYLVHVLKAETHRTYRQMCDEGEKWQEIARLFRWWVRRHCSPLAIMMIPYILIDRMLESMHRQHRQ